MTGSIGKPKPFAASIVKPVCKACGSKFMMICERVPGESGRKFVTDISILHLSQAAKEKRRTIQAKVRSLTVGTKDYIHETSLDESET